MMYFDHFYLHNFRTLEKFLLKTGFTDIRECRAGETKSAAGEELFKAETGREQDDIVVEAVNSDMAPSVSRRPRLYPKNQLLHLLAKYFNLKITHFVPRKQRFPNKYWFKTLRRWNKNDFQEGKE